MPGRHSTTKRPSRAGPILSAVVAVVVIVALGVYLAPRLTEQSDASGCDEAERVSVAAPRDLTAAMRAAAAAMPESDASCLDLSVSTVYPDSSMSQINSNTGSTPTIWILDSKARLAELEPEVRDQVETVGSAATTPIVLGVSRNASHNPPPTWRAAFEYEHFVLPDPASNAAGAFAIGALSAESQGSDVAPVLEELAARQVADDELADDTDTLIRESRREFGVTRWFPVTEQEFVAWSMLRVNWELAAMLPDSGTVVLDYPVVARTDSGPALQAARDLVEFLADTGSSALGDAGFRSATGVALNASALPGDLETLAPPTSIDQLLTAWTDALAAAT